MRKFSIFSVLALNDQELAEEMNLSATASNALEKAQAKRKEKQAEELGEVLLEVLERRENFRTASISRIRDHQRSVVLLKKRLDAERRAFAYAQQTDNYIPLLEVLGYDATHVGTSAEDWKRLSVIPDSFKE